MGFEHAATIVPPAKAETVTAPKNGNGLADVSKSGMPLPMIVGVIGMLAAGLAAFYGMNAKQAQFETALSYERQLDDMRGQLTQERIENAGLRNSALMLSQETARLNAQCSAVVKGR